jgi:hypothetical protein
MQILEPATMVGLGAVALWLYVRYPALRPRTIMRAMAHVGVSFGLFATLPYTVNLFIAVLPGKLALFAFLVLLLIPVLTYVLFSWVSLIAKIHEIAGSTPRGGHPVTDATS